MTGIRGLNALARLAVVWIAVACLSFGVVQAQAAGPAGEDNPTAGLEAASVSTGISNVFMETDLRQALADVGLAAGVTILTDPSVEGYVTLELKDVPLEEALDLMLLPGGFVYKLIRPGVYLVASPDPESPNFTRIAESQTVELDYINSKDLAALLPAAYARYVKFDEAGRRVTVMAPRELLAQTVTEIRNLDVQPVQLLIEALVVDTAAANLKGFDLLLEGKHLSLEAGAGIMTYSGQAEKILLQMLWLAEKQKATIRANPRVVAQEGIPAEVKVGVEQYFQLLTGAIGFQYSTLESIESAISLKITAHVATADGRVTCIIEPQVDDATGLSRDNLPIITRRSVQSTVCVHDGQVIAIGGLLQDMSRETRRKVPILGDIPLIGSLFRSSSVSTDQREIVIFIVPHILDENGRFEGDLLLDGTGLTPAEASAPTVAPSPGRGTAGPGNSAPSDGVQPFDFDATRVR